MLEYSHAEDFFPPEDLDPARDTLRFVLHEDFDSATRRATALSPASAARMRHILEHDTAALAPELLDEIARLEPQLDAVPPPVQPATASAGTMTRRDIKWRRDPGRIGNHHR